MTDCIYKTPELAIYVKGKLIYLVFGGLSRDRTAGWVGWWRADIQSMASGQNRASANTLVTPQEATATP